MIEPENLNSVFNDDGDDTPEDYDWTYVDEGDWLDEPDTGVSED
jgi:hypothetical protein